MNRCVIFGGGEIADIRYTQNLLQKGITSSVQTAVMLTARRSM